MMDTPRIPCDLDSERALLGGLLFGQDAAVSELSADRRWLYPEDFYDARHQTILRAIYELYDTGRPIDLLTVADALGSRLTDVGGRVYLVELFDSVASFANVLAHAEIVKACSRERAALQVGHSIVGSIEAGTFGDAKEACADWARQLDSLAFEIDSGSTSTGLDVARRIDAILEGRMESRGLSTGLRELDTLTGGPYPGRLWVVGGRPGQGKTSFGLGLAVQFAIVHETVALIFSFEQSPSELLDWAICARARVNYFDLERRRNLKMEIPDDVRAKMLTVREDFLSAGDRLKFVEGAQTIDEVAAQVRGEKRRGGVGLVIIDYAQLIGAPRGARYSREQEVSYVSRGAKRIAKTLDVAVVLILQLSRKPMDRAEHKPVLSDLRESGSLEQDADLVLFLHRPREHGVEKVTIRGTTVDSEGYAALVVAKNRFGPTGTAHVAFDGPCRAFGNLETGYESPETGLPF